MRAFNQRRPASRRFAQIVVRIFAGGNLQYGDIHGQLAGEIPRQGLAGDIQAAAGGILARFVSVQREHDALGVARRHQANLGLGHGCAHLRHDIGVARLMRLDHIHIAFGNHNCAALAYGGPTHVQAE